MFQVRDGLRECLRWLEERPRASSFNMDRWLKDVFLLLEICSLCASGYSWFIGELRFFEGREDSKVAFLLGVV